MFLLDENNVTPKLKQEAERRTESNLWYLNNGASNHMTGLRSKFVDLNEIVIGEVRPMTLMSEKEMAHGLPKVVEPKEICRGCSMSKHARNSFPQQTTFNASKILDLVHGDICCPISPPTPGGNSQLSKEESETTRYRRLSDIYNDTEEVELHDELMLIGVDKPVCYSHEIKEKCWEKAMQNEIRAIERNGTWNLVELPAGHKPIGLKWVNNLKKDTKGKIIKYKAQLVAKGYVQKQGVDYKELFAPLTRFERAAKAWYAKLTRCLKKLGFIKGIEVKQGKDGIELKQTTYMKKILQKAGLLECNRVKYPMEERLQLHKDEDGNPVDPTQFKNMLGGL
ncbi:hypothetical protein AgCh_018636 [Apium graveolens]